MYNQGRHSADERINPPLTHSRRIHLLRLKASLEARLSSITAHKKLITVVDLGCGEMPYYPLLAPEVENYIAVDLPGNPKATHYVDLETNECDLNAETADIVLSIQVLEHVESPSLYLRECFRLLKPDGRLLLSTHGQWLYHPDPIDHWRWTSTGLRLELENAGFEVTDLHGVQGFLTVSLQFFQDACLLSFPYKKYWCRPFCFVLQNFMALTEWYIDRSKTLSKHRDVDAAIYVLIAKKK